ncbi:Poly(U)-specific endoribonuclease, partial [Clarias magur]
IGFYIVRDRSDRMSPREGGVGGRTGGVFLENVCFPVSNLVGQRACSVRAPIHGTCCEDA